MGKELSMAEILKVPVEIEEEDKYELSLELSIGGSYGKSSNLIEGKTKEENGTRSAAENGCGFVDLQRKREIQALRRQEARMKREEKLKKSKDKLILEAQKFEGRVQDRESREIDGSFRRKEKNGANEVVQDLNISLFPQVECLGYSCVVPVHGHNVVEKNEENVCGFMAQWNGNGSWNSSMECDSVERSSPAVSDYRSTSQKGGSSSDTGSHSSSLHRDQNQHTSRSDKTEHLEFNDSSPHIEPDQSMKFISSSIQQLQSNTIRATQKPEANTRPDQTDNTCSNVTSGVVSKLPKPPNDCHTGASVRHMPCVSTTGNGPNGKTITGFLYKYTNNEVTIMCSCHWSSFSPAEFVEHAGGVEILHPLRHITMVPQPLE